MFNEGSINSELPRGWGLFNMFINYLDSHFLVFVPGGRLLETGYSLEEVPERELGETQRCETNQVLPWGEAGGPDLHPQTYG
jgi:hypothetical protein